MIRILVVCSFLTYLLLPQVVCSNVTFQSCLYGEFKDLARAPKVLSEYLYSERAKVFKSLIYDAKTPDRERKIVIMKIRKLKSQGMSNKDINDYFNRSINRCLSKNEGWKDLF